ncbi:hypothetical protein CISG_08351 [Coccidioides immitis RMSCC 3703]|uniref:Uncharacterized protein n=2 Tax=Coccidioides immitis TaxID=5501 RepID=A0A0J8R731_COCIT|nr:hypothetical protein CIRG_05694 [Coccidioides immitis RMSCC 2394]KMU80245.1 hypothetical protein CISG_08351 [Coccidioides immitis RMSCC 3703]
MCSGNIPWPAVLPCLRMGPFAYSQHAHIYLSPKNTPVAGQCMAPYVPACSHVPFERLCLLDPRQKSPKEGREGELTLADRQKRFATIPDKTTPSLVQPKPPFGKPVSLPYMR